MKSIRCLGVGGTGESDISQFTFGEELEKKICLHTQMSLSRFDCR